MPTADPAPILALDATQARCSAALWAEGRVFASVEREGQSGDAALLPRMVADLLASRNLRPDALAAIAVAVGPGSFTGLRASLALAHGLAVGADRPVIGVTVAEALAVEAAVEAGGLPIWCALDARNGRLFLQRAVAPELWEVVILEDPPLPEGPVALTGDGAEALAQRLRAAGVVAVATSATRPHARGVAVVAALRQVGGLPPLDPMPLYIDPPRALLPRGGLRPPPLAPRP